MLTAEFDGGSNPRLNRFIAGELQNSELVILHGLRHDILNVAPDRVAGALLDFLRKVAQPAVSLPPFAAADADQRVSPRPPPAFAGTEGANRRNMTFSS